MKNIFLFSIASIVSTIAFCQTNNSANRTIKLTAGRVIFGTGDFFGYSVNVEYAKRLTKNKFASHFAIGSELSFEHGNSQPIIRNPTVQEFLFGPVFRSTTNIALTPKLTYYPFTKIGKGLNLSGGVSFGHTAQAKEFQATRAYDSVAQIYVRRSYLAFKSEALFGYRITTGYEFSTKKILMGARLEFASYTNGDINTFYGLKIGRRF